MKAKIILSGKSTGWSKTDSQRVRRDKTLKSRRGNYLAAARTCLALANINSGKYGDPETRRKANSDAQYFFAKYRASQKRGK
jgi:hypothetical protein